MILNKKRIIFVTGTRADFSKLSGLISCLDSSKYEKLIFITGMHMLKQYGLTKYEIHKFKDIQYVEFVNQRPEDGLDSILTKTITGLSDYILEMLPDLVIFHGDRVESLAAALACCTNYITSVHIEGGELSGTVDEIFRHTITKLSDYHLVCSNEAKKRITQLGENPDQIKNIGSRELDFHSKDSGITIDTVKHYYNIPFEDYGICIFHPVTTEIDTISSQTREFFKCLEKSNRNFIIIEPNNDLGCEQIREAIYNLPKSRFKIIPSMRFNYFSELMKNASLFVGNSSVGVREAPFIGISSINIGSRQDRRADSLSITHISDLFQIDLLPIINEQWGQRHESCKNFWAGGAIEAFKNFIDNESIYKTGKQKKFFDLKEQTNL